MPPLHYVALLRGVSPMNVSMTELKTCFEKLGFTDVKTVLSSGNVIFSANKSTESSLAKKIESGLAKHLPRSFPVIVRTSDHLRALLKTDPYAEFRISPKEKCVVTFMGQPHHSSLSLPMESDGVRILTISGNEVFTAYTPNERGPVFMTLIEKTFGKNVTTRTWDTVKKCAAT
jgi:uncharacterized protein (DUF1697 family)